MSEKDELQKQAEEAEAEFYAMGKHFDRTGFFTAEDEELANLCITKKRTFSLELTDADTTAFIKKCYQDGTTPAEVLEGFICDLTGAQRSRGSDERMCAEQYYNRCGYGYFFSGEYRSFLQWLLYEELINTVADLLEDLTDIEEELQYFKDHPGEAAEGEPEDLEENKADFKEQLEKIHLEYAKEATKPDTLEEGIKSVREYLETMRKAKEGGAI
jgi:hypothetical protein